jgi:A/G-specific adenine glycosylase
MTEYGVEPTPGREPRLPPADVPLPAALAPALLAWFDTARRPLPWRRSRDPYRIWVAEVLLQQTRVAQAIPYFERFVAAFPDVDALAAADPTDVLRVWAGAGYYARARHLAAAARTVRDRWGGKLPSTVDELRTLPGIGPYIARAIAALAFDRPVVALEANGRRVAARWALERGDVRLSAVAGRLEAELARVLPPDRAGAFNEAVMELGETVCLPRAPRCPVCPVTVHCRARRELRDPGALPSRGPRRQRPHVRGAVAVVAAGGRWLVQRRPPTGLLGGLFEFPGGKIERGERPLDAAVRELREETGLRAPSLRPVGVVRHAYSHFTVELHVFAGRYARRPRAAPGSDRRWVTPLELAALPLPRATAKIVAQLMSSGRASPGSGSRPGRTPPSPRAAGGPRSARAPARRRGASGGRSRAPR